MENTMSRRSLGTAIALIGVGVVAGVILMTSFSTNAIEQLFAQDVELGAASPPAPAPPAVKLLNDQFANVAGAVTQSVVSISVKTDRKSMMRGMPQDFFRFFGPDFGAPNEEDESPQLPEGEASGSGVVITADGYVVTNNHVVESAKEGGITVTTIDQKQFKAKLVGRDPLTDLAVLKIDGRFSPAHLAQRSDIRIGEWVVAVGSPLGLKSTVTTGIVSAMGRSIGIVGTNEMNSQRNRYAAENFIQTDAAINPGNSGGGLFNLNGSLVGINTAIASQSGVNAGYGFAIPIDMVRSVVLDLIDDGKIERGYIGVEITSVDEATAKAVGLSKVAGVSVNRVVKGGAAEAAGLEVGDVILDVDGKPVKTSSDLQNEIVLRRAGDKVNLKIWRDGREIAKTVKLKAPDGVDVASRSGSDDNSRAVDESEPVTIKGLGFTAAALTSEQRSTFNVKTGVYVAKVDRMGQMARRGLRQGTVILKADGKEVFSPAQLKRVISAKEPGDGMMFVVKDSDGSKQAITVEVPEL
ncbi:MAG: PDZ domain-containing protein [Candidatus Kapabacteria bacterium]|nr:PDZ domain-containing protein [Candidatus Kapabacteria bacterium]